MDCFKVGVGTSAGEIDSVPDGGDEEESRGGSVNINPLLNEAVWVVGDGSSEAAKVVGTLGLGETELGGQGGA